MFKELNEIEFNTLDNQAKKDYLKKELNYKVEIFIIGTSAYNADNASKKAIAVTELLFIKLFQLSIEKKVSFREVMNAMIMNAYNNYSQTSKIMDYTAFLLNALNYQSENDKKQIQAENAFNRLLQKGLLFSIRDSGRYKSDDKTLLAALKKTGLSYIQSQVKCLDGINSMSDYSLNSIKKEFIKNYLDCLKTGTDIKVLIGSKARIFFGDGGEYDGFCDVKADYPVMEVKQLAAPENDNFLLNLESVSESIVKGFLNR